MRKNVKLCLAILFAAVLVFGTVGVAMAGNLEVDDAGGNEDEIIFGSQTKEDGYIGTEMPVSIDENATETDYYIESVEQFNNFQAISKTNNFAGLTVHLAANVSLDENFVGIGSDEVPFAGTFNGHGYAITKLSSTANGLFVAVEGATIQKLVIGSAKVTASEATASAGILANAANGATVDRVIISGSKLTVAAETTVGGMFGKVTGEVTITDSTVRRLLVKTAGEASAVGGFVGNAEATVTTENCAVVNSYTKDTESVFVNCTVLNGTVNGTEGTFSGN